MSRATLELIEARREIARLKEELAKAQKQLEREQTIYKTVAEILARDDGGDKAMIKGKWPATRQATSKPVQALFDRMVSDHVKQAVVAQRMGKHAVTLSYWRNGVHDMRGADLEHMADVLGYSWQLVKNGARIDGKEDAA